jgi:hypothetical protein
VGHACAAAGGGGRAAAGRGADLQRADQPSFTGERELPTAFFFVNLFAHIALPLSIGVLLWVHVARLSRPVLLPSRGVLWGSMLALTAAAVLWPLPMAPAADLLRMPRGVPLDWFYGFWLPVTQRLPAGVVWLSAGAAGAGRWRCRG